MKRHFRRGDAVYVRPAVANNAKLLVYGGYGVVVEVQAGCVLVDVVGSGVTRVNRTRLQADPGRADEADQIGNPWSTNSRYALEAHARLPAGRFVPGVLLADQDEDRDCDDTKAASREREARRRALIRARQVDAGSRAA